MSDLRRDFTQASLNLATWKIVAIEILVFSIALASYLSNIYIFAASISTFLILFYFKITAIFASIFFALLWALMPSMIISIFTYANFIESLRQSLSSASFQVLAFILFWVSFYYHITCADFLRDALDPLFKIFKRPSVKHSNKNEVIKKEAQKNSFSKGHANIAFIKNDKVDPHLLRLFLEDNGFGLYQSSEDRNTEKRIVLNENGVIKFFNIIETKRWVSNYINELSSGSPNLLGAWVKFSDIALKKSVIDHLIVYSSNGYENTKQLNILKDTEHECYFKFKNCIIKITEDNYEVISYKDIKGAVWETSIIKKDFNGISKLLDNTSKTGNHFFREFVEKSILYKNSSSDSPNWRNEYIANASTNSALLSLRTAFGYLVHSYNDPSCAKAVFFVDKLSTQGKPEGGTGKSLIVSSLGHLIKQSPQDGKKYRDNPNLGGRFQFSNVDLDTKNIFIDDLKQDFSTESIFTMVTGDLEIERKGKDKVVISKTERPKIALTTNYKVLNDGTSFKRRIHQVELGDYWNRCINEGIHPKDEIGVELFGYDFSQDDWDDFYVFAIECVRDYLILGLKQL